MVEAARGFEEVNQRTILRLSQKTQEGHMNAFFGYLDEYIPVNGFNLFLTDHSQSGKCLPFDKDLAVASKINPHKFFLKIFARSKEFGKTIVGLKYAVDVEVVLTTLTPDKMFLNEAERKILFDQVSVFSKMAAKGEFDPDWEKLKFSSRKCNSEVYERIAKAMVSGAKSSRFQPRVMGRGGSLAALKQT